MDVFVARQPIFNRSRRLFAYELLFRTGLANAFPGVEDGLATSSLLSSSYFTVGIEQITSGHRAFINFPEEMLLRGIPGLFPARSIVVEILEDVDPSEEVVLACKKLVKKGYQLALDDFVYTRAHHPLMELAKIVKVDFTISSLDEIKEIVAFSTRFHFKLLAEKIETYEEFALARSLGFVYFQGYFFSKPEVLQNKEISSSQLIYMKLIMEINRAEFDVRKLEVLVMQDVAISYKLLKCINSAYYSRLQPITSIRNAIAYLGEQGVRMFVSLIATAKLSESKPDELLRTSCIRARFLELVAGELGRNREEAFMLGLFSLLDAILDTPMESLMRQLPVSSDIVQALVHQSGPLYPLLNLIQIYEAGQWVELDAAIHDQGLVSSNMIEYYLDAVRWAGFFT
jgi:EAL and modified HD-GYP domain-containing signal transduction protein